jgi:O-antigen/teichoic acid export membrane protein
MRRTTQNITDRLTKNAFLMTCLEMIVRYGVSVVVLPVALKKLESVELAYYLFISTLMALAYLADSGFSQTIVRASAYFKAGAAEIPERVTELTFADTKNKPNWQAVGRLIATSNRIYLLIGLAATVLLSTLGVGAALNIISQQNNRVDAWLSYFLLIVLSFFLLQVSRWSSLLQGLNEVARAKRIELVLGVIRLFGIAAALLAGFGVLGVVSVMCITALVSLFLTRMAVIQIIRENGVHKEHEILDSEMLKKLWPSTWRMGVICWGSYLIYYGSSLVVSQIPDSKQIASYLLTFQVVTLLYRFATSPSLVYQPQVAAAVSNGDLGRVNYLTMKIMRYSLAMYVLGGLLIYYFGGDALILIKSKSQMLSSDILLLMLVMYLLEMQHSIHAGIYIATNHVPFMVPALASGLAIVLLGGLASKTYGTTGIITTQLLVQASFNNWYPVYLSLKLQNMTFATYVAKLFDLRNHHHKSSCSS